MNCARVNCGTWSMFLRSLQRSHVLLRRPGAARPRRRGKARVARQGGEVAAPKPPHEVVGVERGEAVAVEGACRGVLEDVRERQLGALWVGEGGKDKQAVR